MVETIHFDPNLYYHCIHCQLVDTKQDSKILRVDHLYTKSEFTILPMFIL